MSRLVRVPKLCMQAHCSKLKKLLRTPKLIDSEDEQKIDSEGDVVMDVNLDQHFKIYNLDKVNYFSERQVNQIQQAIVGQEVRSYSLRRERGRTSYCQR